MKDDEAKDDNGTSVMGDSGEELGEGSDKEHESTVDIVVVGDDSVESDVCIRELSRYSSDCDCAGEVLGSTCVCWVRGCAIGGMLVCEPEYDVDPASLILVAPKPSPLSEFRSIP